jgi:hypothetical protein
MKSAKYCKSFSIRDVQAIMLEKITAIFSVFVCQVRLSRPMINIGNFIDSLVCSLFTTHDATDFSH